MSSDYEFRQCLSPSARKAAAIVAHIRDEEQKGVWRTESQESHELFPGMMFNAAKSHMERTHLWKIVRKMPKGALLHAQ